MGRYDKMMEKFEQELDVIQNKIVAGTDISDKDLLRAEQLAHTLKSLVCYCEKKDELEGAQEYGMSGRRGRNSYNGQYMSRDMSYDDGMSGRYPYRGDWPPYNGTPWR